MEKQNNETEEEWLDRMDKTFKRTDNLDGKRNIALFEIAYALKKISITLERMSKK